MERIFVCLPCSIFSLLSRDLDRSAFWMLMECVQKKRNEIMWVSESWVKLSAWQKKLSWSTLSFCSIILRCSQDFSSDFEWKNFSFASISSIHRALLNLNDFDDSILDFWSKAETVSLLCKKHSPKIIEIQHRKRRNEIFLPRRTKSFFLWFFSSFVQPTSTWRLVKCDGDEIWIFDLNSLLDINSRRLLEVEEKRRKKVMHAWIARNCANESRKMREKIWKMKNWRSNVTFNYLWKSHTLPIDL